jgi:predicted GNAT superfamily acetyltransferase
MRHEQDKDLFLAFAKENSKYVKQIERAYYGVITDAIESCFAFDLNPEDYQLKVTLPKDASYSDALKKALAIEEKILNFYQVATEQSKHLMADVPRSFTLVAKKRSERVPKLKELLEKVNPVRNVGL